MASKHFFCRTIPLPVGDYCKQLLLFGIEAVNLRVCNSSAFTEIPIAELQDVTELHEHCTSVLIFSNHSATEPRLLDVMYCIFFNNLGRPTVVYIIMAISY